MSIVRQSKTLFIKKQSKTAPMHSVHTFISHTKLPLLVIPIGVRRLPAHTSGLLRLFCTQKASHVHPSRWCHPGHMTIRQSHLKHIVHTSRTIQTRTLASTGDGALIEVSVVPRGLVGLSCGAQSLCARMRWMRYRRVIDNPRRASFTPPGPFKRVR